MSEQVKWTESMRTPFTRSPVHFIHRFRVPGAKFADLNRHDSEPTPEFDLGPLSWVQGEIDQALSEGLEALAQFRANPERRHVAQACALARPSGGGRHPDGRSRCGRRLHRRARAPTDSPRGTAADGSDRRLRRRGSRVPQAQDLSRRAGQLACRRCRSSCIRNTKRCKARAASRRLLRPISSIRTCRRAPRASRRAKRSRPISFPRIS